MPLVRHKIKRYGWVPDTPDQRDHLYCRAGRAHENARKSNRLAAPMPQNHLRPGPTRQLHRQRDRVRDSVRTPEAKTQARLHPVAALHLLQRARHGRNDQVGQRRADSRRHQERGEARRLPGTRMAIRHQEIRHHGRRKNALPTLSNTRRCRISGSSRLSTR